MNTRKIVKNIYKNALIIINGWLDGDWNKPDSWVSLGVALAEVIDKYDEISGKVKKQIVIETIIQIISDENIFKNIDLDDREKVIGIVKLILPTSLDFIIMATKGQININVPEPVKNICCCINKEKKIK